MRVTICKHCGARVEGDVCEYCDMPVESQYSPKYRDLNLERPNTAVKNTVSPSFTYVKPKEKKSKKHIFPFLALVFVIFYSVRSIIIPSIILHSICTSSTSSATVSDSIVTDNKYSSDYNKNQEQVKSESKSAKKTVYSSNEIFEENGIYPSGTYEIGVDIPEGLYIFIPQQDGHGIEAIYSDPSCNNQISAEYVHFDGSRIAEISGKGYLDTSWCTAYNLDKHPEIVNDPFAGEGMFVVGRDIDAGTYKLCETDEQYYDCASWTIYSSINAIAPIICQTGNSDYGEFVNVIKLEEGQYLKTQFCRVEKKLD